MWRLSILCASFCEVHVQALVAGLAFYDHHPMLPLGPKIQENQGCGFLF
jgi:hypothetical protein